jgi:hypothetical protein
MPEEVWHYLENQFDSATRGRRRRMNAILFDAVAKITQGAAANPALAPVLAVLATPKTQWDAAYGGWKNRRAEYRASTQALLNLLAALRTAPGPGQRSKLDRWESRVQNFWPATHEIYVYLFPRGREPFSVGSRDEIIAEVLGLGQRAAAKGAELTTAAGQPGLDPALAAELAEQGAALTALGTEVTAFHGQLQAARDAQTVKEGLVDQAAALCEQRRREAAWALYRAKSKLCDLFGTPEQIMQVAGFFDLGLIMSPPQADEDEPEPDGLPTPQNVSFTQPDSGGAVVATADPVPEAALYRAYARPAGDSGAPTLVATSATLPLSFTHAAGEWEFTLTAATDEEESAPSAPVVLTVE